MKKYIVLLVVLGACVGFVGCDTEDTSTNKEKQYQEELMQQANDEVGMPEITEFYEKKLAKEIFEKRDNSDLVCYAYSQNLNGKLVYIGKCMGYGLPYSTQYTNPEMVSGYYSNTGRFVVPQADPNGLYGADGLSATWLMMIDENRGESYIMYCEPTIIVTETKMASRLVEAWSLPSDY